MLWGPLRMGIFCRALWNADDKSRLDAGRRRQLPANELSFSVSLTAADA